MTDVYVGDSDFTALVAGDEVSALPLTTMFDRIKNFLKGSVANAKIKISTLEVTSDIYSVALTDYSNDSIITGFSSVTNKSIYYKKVGKIVYIYYGILGVSNANEFTFTVPYDNKSGITIYGACSYGNNNSGANDSFPWIKIDNNSSIIVASRAGGAGTWTTSNNKAIYGQFWYETS